MWRSWLPCPINMLCWLVHLLLTQIVTFNHCFGNAAYNTSQMQAAVVQVIKPHRVTLVDLCDPARVTVMDGIFSAWWAWHVLFKYHLRPASSQRTVVHPVLRRQWLLRAKTMSHIPEKPSYWRHYLSPRGHLQVSGSPFKQEKVFAFTLPLPNMWVTELLKKASLTSKLSSGLKESFDAISRKVLSVDSKPFLKTFTVVPPAYAYFWGTASFPPSLPLKPEGTLLVFLSKTVGNQHAVGGAEKRRFSITWNWEEICFPSLNLLL